MAKTLTTSILLGLLVVAGCDSPRPTTKGTNVSTPSVPPAPPGPPANVPPPTANSAYTSPHASTAATQPSTTIKNGAFSISAPDGFVEKMGVLYHDKLRASLQFSYNANRPFTSVAAEFTPEALAPGWSKLISKENVKVNGTDGFLMYVSNAGARGTKFQWCIVFPSGSGTAQVGSVFPQETEKDASATMRSALLTVTHRP